jgi:hypothetical protein
VRVAPKMAGPLWRFGRGERAKRRCLPEMSRGSADTNRVAPFCVRQLEVQVRPNHLGTLRDTPVSRRCWPATAFVACSRNQCRSLKAAIRRVLPGWFGPGVGNLSVDIVGRRTDWQSSPLRLPNTETAGKSRSTESAQRLGSHFPPLPSCSAYFDYIGTRCTDPGKGLVTGQPARAVADVR